jgi:hypothetical protein
MIETENFYVEASDSFDFVVAKSTVGDMRLKLVVHECNMFNDYDYTQSNCHHNLAPVSDHPSFPYNQEFKASILESRKFKFFGSSRYPSQI